MRPLKPSDESVDLAAIARYLSGESSVAEAARVRQWIVVDPARQAQVDEVRRALELAGTPRMTWDINTVWRGLEQRIERTEQSSPDSPSPKLVAERGKFAPLVSTPIWSSFAKRMSFRIAAMLLIAIAATAGWYRLRPKAYHQDVAVREYKTPRGQRATVRLPDGSHVVLGAASELRVAGDFGSRTRDVTLVGEAYFDVIHDAARPFLVHTTDGVTEDLGTTFVVRAYPDEHVARVAVASGRVALRSKMWGLGQGAVLAAGDVGRLTQRGQATVERKADLAPYLGWMDGTLAFDNTPLRDAIRDIERQYDVEIQVSDSAVLERRFTATFKSRDVDAILNVISTMIDGHAERHGRVITLSRHRAA